MRDLDTLPIIKRPFRLLAKRLGIREGILLSTLKTYKKNGLIRRFGAILDHRKVDLKVNALVVWKVKKKRIDSAGNLIAKFAQVSHCYLRRSYSCWSYNLYAMLHAANQESILRLIKEISHEIKPDTYRILFTLKEFKKTRPILRDCQKNLKTEQSLRALKHLRIRRDLFLE